MWPFLFYIYGKASRLRSQFQSLKKKNDFRRVYREGKSKANRVFVMNVLPNHLKDNRVGISVSKKVGNSVVRHRTIRLLIESYLRVKEQLPPGYHIVVVAKPEAKDKGLAEISGAFEQLLKKKKLV